METASCLASVPAVLAAAAAAAGAEQHPGSWHSRHRPATAVQGAPCCLRCPSLHLRLLPRRLQRSQLQQHLLPAALMTCWVWATRLQMPWQASSPLRLPQQHPQAHPQPHSQPLKSSPAGGLHLTDSPVMSNHRDLGKVSLIHFWFPALVSGTANCAASPVPSWLNWPWLEQVLQAVSQVQLVLGGLFTSTSPLSPWMGAAPRRELLGAAAVLLGHAVGAVACLPQ